MAASIEGEQQAPLADSFRTGEARDTSAHIPTSPEFNEARSKALMRVLTSIVWVTDPDGRFLAPQPTWAAYTGQTWPEMQEHGWFKAIHPEDQADIRGCLEKARDARTLFRASGRLWHAPSQAYRHIEARGVPIMDTHGRILEWVGTCRDVDEQKRAETVLRESDRRKDEFIAVLAHELRNPLAPIRNAIEVLKMRGSGDMQLTWARTIVERQVAQMAHLLDDLLDVSRISQNKLELRKARVTLDSVLDQAIEVSRPHWEQNGHQFELLVLAAPIYLEADANRLAQAFSNLLINASKYTNRGGRITLTVRRDGNDAVVEVQDTGIGVSPEMLPRLFDLFTQDAPALERAQGGLGIGLSIVKAIVELHGGTVQARSEGPSRGSVFTVRLPAAGRRPADVAAQVNGTRVQGSLRILVADDNRDAAESMSVLLEMHGHDVKVADDGEQALAVAREFVPDVALLDIGMPKLNGYEVAEAMRNMVPRPLLVAATGWGQRDDLRRANAAGFDHHMVKPIDLDQLTKVLADKSRQLSQAHAEPAVPAAAPPPAAAADIARLDGIARELREQYAGRVRPPDSKPLSHYLREVREALRMDIAFLSEFVADKRVFLMVSVSAESAPLAPGSSDPLIDTYCQRVVAGELPRCIPDTGALAAAAELPITRTLRIGAYLSAPVVLRNGRVFGTLCCLRHLPRPALSQKDADALAQVADAIAAVIDRDGRLPGEAPVG